MALPFTIDYTSRDFDAIRADILSYADAVLPQWRSRDPNDFGVVLVELFAGVADMLNYYIDRAASEAYLDTAVQRSSILSIARMLGYAPTTTTAATATLTLNNNLTTQLTVPAGTRFFAVSSIDGQPYHVYFESDADVVVPAANNTGNGIATVTATQGTTVSQEAVGTSDGSLAQTFALFRPNVATGSIRIEVDETGFWAPWRTVEHVLDFGPNDAVCETFEDENGISYIRFGDNVSGRIPTIGSSIRVTYRVCDGAMGNVAAKTITATLEPIIGLVGVANSAPATGGADSESNEHIRLNAPRALRASNRAVALGDYADLALQVQGVGKAKSAQTGPTSVTIYVSPAAASDPVTTLKDAVAAYLADKSTVGTSVVVAGPTYQPLDITATVMVRPQYRQDYVRSGVIQAITSVLAFDQVDFGDIVVPADILNAIFSVDGVMTATIQVLDRSGSTGGGGVALNPNEIPTLGTLGLAMQNGIV